MVLKQYYLGCLAHASYLVADPAAGVAAVVDPQRDVDAYVADARELGCRIGHVVLTHFHADFLAGHLELRDREGARICLGARAAAEYDFTPLGDGAMVAVGAVRLEAVETPGHSPESISLLVHAPGGDPARPHALLSGDTLFVGDVGRPDLRASLGWAADDLAGLLYDSLHEKLMRLPDETLVYPAHGSGSLCGKSLSKETVSTIGAQRRDNYALQPMSRSEFVALVTADQPDTPAYFTYDAVLNTRERATLDAALAEELRPLTLDEALAWARDGARLLDTRDPADFAAAHLAGSFNIGLGGSYATWAGTLLEPGRPIVIVAWPGAEREAATRLGRIGFDAVAGYLDGGMGALAGAPELVASFGRLSPGALAEALDDESPPLVLDVRAEAEHRADGIEGSVGIPLTRLAARAGELPPDRPVVVCCGSGYRSAIAVSLLRAGGRAAVTDLAGGMAAWRLWRSSAAAGAAWA
jgi:glyoxylase-like metal-dependent hydrolase (beta-lactamase superfamily II)/rhodanese-related sulfurtransferase